VKRAVAERVIEGSLQETTATSDSSAARNSTPTTQLTARTQAAERASTMEKREASLLARIHATLEEMKTPLGRVKTPGLQELFDNLTKQFVDYHKAHNATSREWRSTIAAERSRVEALKSTRSVNA